MSQFGNGLIVAGLAMFVAVLFLAYSLYAGLSNQGPQTPLPTPAISNSTNVLGLFMNNVTLILYSESYIIIKIVILFLLSYVGGKLVGLGINANRSEMQDETDEDKPKRGKNSTSPY